MDFSSLIQGEISKKRRDSKQEKKNKKVKLRKKHGDFDSTNTEHDGKGTKLSEFELKKGQEISVTASNGEESLSPRLTEQSGLPKESDERKRQEKYDRYKIQLQQENEVSKDIIVDEVTDANYKDKLCLQLRVFLKAVLKEWESKLQRENTMDEVNDDHSVFSSEAILRETKMDLVRLLYKLRAKKLDAQMLTSLGTIVYHLQHGEFMNANEAYMKLSIGNVAWPIGVKSIGIHESSYTQKISGDNRLKGSNIMIDDKTRRWITAVKRIISFVESNR